MDLQYIKEESNRIIDNYNGDIEMAHVREDNFIIDFLHSIKNSLEDENTTFEEFKLDTINKIKLILEMNKKTEDKKWYA